MNPKSTASLDPKLKEAYERIMGTTVPQAPLAQNLQPSTAPVLPQAPQQPNMSSEASKPIDAPLPPAVPKLQVQEVPQEPLTIQTPDLPLPPRSEPVSGEMVQSPQSPVFNSKKNAYTPSQPTAPQPSAINTGNMEALNPKKKRKIMPIFLTLGGLVFFVTYGVIWAKVFGLF